MSKMADTHTTETGFEWALIKRRYPVTSNHKPEAQKPLPALQNLPVCSFQPPLCPPEETTSLTYGNTSLKKWFYLLCVQQYCLFFLLST